jgi:hypothetical protein
MKPAAFKEAVTHHALPKEEKDDGQDDYKQELSNPERGWLSSCGRSVVHGLLRAGTTDGCPLCALFSCRYFLKHVQRPERIIEKLALGRIGKIFSRPFANRTTGSQNPLGQFGVVKFQNRVFVEHLPQSGSGYTGGKTSGRHKADPRLGKSLARRR